LAVRIKVNLLISVETLIKSVRRLEHQ